MHALLFLLAICFGLCMPLQMGLNSILQQHWANSALVASFVSFLVGGIALGVFLIIARVPVPALSSSSAPWYAWLGGLIGAVGVTTLTYLAPKIGALAMLSLVIFGQLVGSLIFDHFGLLGYVVRPVSVMRILGVLFLLCGMFLVNKY